MHLPDLIRWLNSQSEKVRRNDADIEKRTGIKRNDFPYGILVALIFLAWMVWIGYALFHR
jgi:hypothetical protein